MQHSVRRRWSLAILLIGLPIWIVLASSAMTWAGRPPVLVELLVYLALGVIWTLPFRSMFRGVGQLPPDESGGGE